MSKCVECGKLHIGLTNNTDLTNRCNSCLNGYNANRVEELEAQVRYWKGEAEAQAKNTLTASRNNKELGAENAKWKEATKAVVKDAELNGGGCGPFYGVNCKKLEALAALIQESE